MLKNDKNYSVKYTCQNVVILLIIYYLIYIKGQNYYKVNKDARRVKPLGTVPLIPKRQVATQRRNVFVIISLIFPTVGLLKIFCYI